MKQSFIGILCFFILAVNVSISAALEKRYDSRTKSCRVLSSGPLEWESLPWGQGGKAFKQVCKKCHTRKNTTNATNATFLWEESKTSRGWNRVFANMRVKCAKDGSWSELSDEQLLMVNDYLYRWSSTRMARDENV